jgi:hypothetical protein
MLWDESADALTFPDSTYLYLGAGNDLQLYHNGTDSHIANYAGDLYITQHTDDEDLIFRCDDGSGGFETYFYLDGSLSSGSPFTVFPDNARLALGSSTDMYMYHNGTDTTINNDTGDLYIKNSANDKDIIFQSDDGSGGVATYFFLDGSQTGHTLFPDNSVIDMGGGRDLQLYHNGTNSYITNNTGDLYITNQLDDKDILFRGDDGSGGVHTYLTLDGGLGYTTVQKEMRFDDSTAATFGASGDLQISHNGSSSSLANYTANFFIQNQADDADIIFQCDDGSGGVETYFYLDGSASSGNPITIFPDNSQLAFGNSADLVIKHDGSNTYIYNEIGNFQIFNKADDSDLILSSDDGSGGTTAYLTLDGSTKTVDVDVPIEINDQMLLGAKATYTLPAQGTRMRLLQIADNTLCRVYLDASENNYHQSIVLDIFYRAQYDTSKPQIIRSENYEWHQHSNDIIFTSDLSGAAEADNYIYAEKVSYSTGRTVKIRKIEVFDGVVTVLDGSTTDANGGTDETIISSFAQLNLGDNDHLKIGDGEDLQLYHDGTDSLINNATGDLNITNNANDKDIAFFSDNGSGGVIDYFFLDGSAADGTYTYTEFRDQSKLVFGNSQDLQIHHTGGTSFIEIL